MTGYQAIDGVPCTSNRWLLTDLLRGSWGFEGFVVTDWNNVDHLIRSQRVCADHDDASRLALHAGNDMMMTSPGFYEAIIRSAREGTVPEVEVDEACRRVLRLKFALGLFENPRLPDAARQKVVVGCASHGEVNLRVAREPIVLLKNTGVLPLDPSAVRKVAVVGPQANDPAAQLGDWTLGTGQAGKGEHPREQITTVLDGLVRRLGAERTVHARGCSAHDPADAAIDEAVAAARGADVAVVAVGDTLPYIGEGKSTATLSLMGRQQELLEAVHATGTPMVVVLVNSKPLCVTWVKEHAAAVIEAWNPGMRGGTALAEILCGDINPQGRLAISFPRHAGQQPVFYNQLPGQHGGSYADLTQEPLWVFGEGMSYTTFRYENLRVSPQRSSLSGSVTVSVDLSNTGQRDGVETVQLYIDDVVTSVTWPHKVLKAYKRVELKAGERRTVELSVPCGELWLIDADCRRVVEPGEFGAMVGPSSRDSDLLRASFRLT